MDLGAALLAVFIAVMVKGTVMVLAVPALFRALRATRAERPRRLWRLVPRDDGATARILFWALACFALSELTCGVEIYVLARSSPWLEGTHAVTSAVAMALFALGLYRAVDGRALRFGEPGCAMVRVCRTCTVREPMGCKLRPSVLLLATLVPLAALLPLVASTARLDANLHRFALPLPALNAAWDRAVVPWLAAHVPGYAPTGVAFFVPSSVLTIELRVVPAAAIVLATLALLHLRAHRLARGMDLLLLATGPLAYSLFELLLYRGTGDLLLGELGHELGELWFLLFTVELLGRLFPRAATEPSLAK